MKIYKTKDKWTRVGLGCMLISAMAACGGGSGPIAPAKPASNLAPDKVADRDNWTYAPFAGTPPGAGISAAAAVILEGYTAGIETNNRLFVFPNGLPALGLPAGSTLRWKWADTVGVDIPATATLPADPLNTLEISTSRVTTPATPVFHVCAPKEGATPAAVERCSVPAANPATSNAPGSGSVTMRTMTNTIDSPTNLYNHAIGIFRPDSCTFDVGPIYLGIVSVSNAPGWIGYVSTVPGRGAPVMNNFPVGHPLEKSKSVNLNAAGKICRIEVDTRGLKADKTPESRDVVLNLDGVKSNPIKAMVTVDGDGKVLVNQAPLLISPVVLVPK
jgi:hypothetical protein